MKPAGAGMCRSRGIVEDPRKTMPTLNRIGKDAVVGHHLRVPFRLPKDVPDVACGALLRDAERGDIEVVARKVAST